MLLLALCVWATADICIKLYFARLRNADYRKWLQKQLGAIDDQCLYCKRLRGHDDDCGLDMASLPPPSHAVASTEKRSDYYEDMP